MVTAFERKPAVLTAEEDGPAHRAFAHQERAPVIVTSFPQQQQVGVQWQQQQRHDPYAKIREEQARSQQLQQ